MRQAPLIIIFAIATAGCAAQEPGMYKTFKDPQVFISIDPVRILFIDQIGLTFQYREDHMGIGFSAGYKYAGGRNSSRLLIATSNNKGPFEFYNGYYFMPNLNIYFNKPKWRTVNLLGYLIAKGNYKYLSVDSVNFYVWDNTLSEGNFYLRRQIDKVNILGATFGFGMTLIIRKFFIDYNFGAGWILHHHNMVVAGEKNQAGSNPNLGKNLPRKETMWYNSPTANFCLSVGVCF